MSERAKLMKLMVHLQMESEFTSAPDLLGKTVADLETTDQLLDRLQKGATLEEVQADAQTLLNQYESGREETEVWSTEMLNRRFNEYTAIPNSPRIENSKLVEPKTTAEERVEMAQHHGFRFDRFSNLLNELKFWQKVGPMLEQLPSEQGGVTPGQVDWNDCKFSLTHPNFRSLMNAINGSAPIRYEEAFAEFQNQFDQLKRDKYHLTDEIIQQKKDDGKSPLSMPDILGVLVIDRLNKEAGFQPDQQKEIEEINAAIVNDKVSDQDRIKLYKRLQDIYANVTETPFSKLAQSAVDEVALPDEHPDTVNNLTELKNKWSSVEAVHVLGSSDDGLNAVVAANAIYEYPDAFMIPSGGLAPFQFQTNKQPSATTEAQHMIAMVTNSDLPKNYPWKYPHTPDLSGARRLNQYDILSPDMSSMSTQTNANETTKRLIVLQQNLDNKPLHVLVVTNNYHARRAKFDFEKQLQASVVAAQVRIFENTQAPLLAKPVEERNPHAWQYIFGEINKGLYTVTTNIKIS